MKKLQLKVETKSAINHFRTAGKKKKKIRNHPLPASASGGYFPHHFGGGLRMNEIISCTTQRVKGRSREPQKLKLNFPQKLCSSRFSFFFLQLQTRCSSSTHTDKHEKREKNGRIFHEKENQQQQRIVAILVFVFQNSFALFEGEKRSLTPPPLDNGRPRKECSILHFFFSIRLATRQGNAWENGCPSPPPTLGKILEKSGN